VPASASNTRDAYVSRVVSTAPPLTPSQAETVRAALRGSRQGKR
jgi:hypothetical protein